MKLLVSVLVTVVLATIGNVYGGSGSFNICYLVPDPGYYCPDSMPSDGPTEDDTRYYYDPELEYCLDFPYKGCGGNPNNFENFTYCEAICIYGGNTLPEDLIPLGQERSNKDDFFNIQF